MSRIKGNSAEREIAHMMEQWWGQYEECKFIRTLVGNLLVSCKVYIMRKNNYPEHRKRKLISVRFFEKVVVDTVTKCWVWVGLCNKKNYGRFGDENGKMVLAHRFSWELKFGKIDDCTTCVCHKCDNPPCVNPDHLFLGTKQENNQDMINKGRFRAASGEFNGRKKHPERWPVGESIHCSKLTTTDVIEIRAKYSTEKTSYVKLANQYGVGKTTIERIVKGRKWKHVK